MSALVILEYVWFARHLKWDFFFGCVLFLTILISMFTYEKTEKNPGENSWINGRRFIMQ